MDIKRWLNKKTTKQIGNGLFASLDELLEMRKYTAYVQQNAHRNTLSCQSGDIRSAFKGRGMEFEEIRSYTFGDDVRDIDWRVTARKEQPYTKIYNEEKDHEIYVWIDLSASMLFGSKKELKSVTASKIASLLGWLALENKDRFGVVIFDGTESFWFKPKNSRAQLLAILKKISEVGRNVLQTQVQDRQNLIKSLKILEQNARNKASVFLISDFGMINENLRQQLAMLARKTNLYLINVFDALEENPPKSGEYMAEYAGKRLVFNSSSKMYRHNYFTYFAKKRTELNLFCKKYGCKLVEFRTDMDMTVNLKLL
ncbi:MAG: DUF58 domain-containing protein [Alphaproteobacteria bacterium]|nr:DUF58 domain-containing protein [Alphaproteobacteria bacterium]